MEKATTKTKILPKRIENQFFNCFLIRILIGKSNRQNQNIAKSWKNQFSYFWISILLEKKQPPKPRYCQNWKFSFFNYFLIKTLIWKSNHQNPDITKRSKKLLFNYFLFKTLIRKSNHQNQDIANSWKINFQYAWDQKKNKDFHWKSNSGFKNSRNLFEKRAQHRLPQCLKPKKQTLSLKNQFSIGLRPKKQRLSLKKQFGS